MRKSGVVLDALKDKRGQVDNTSWFLTPIMGTYCGGEIHVGQSDVCSKT